jgi:hypothetical protein
MTSLVNMLRDNGTWEADAAAAKIARLEDALEKTGNALLSQIETSSELADRVVKLETALREIIQEDALTGKTVFVGDFGKIARKALEELRAP